MRYKKPQRCRVCGKSRTEYGHLKDLHRHVLNRAKSELFDKEVQQIKNPSEKILKCPHFNYYLKRWLKLG